jgi:energy-coupling factor transporter ATP-binding protein EcfA2
LYEYVTQEVTFATGRVISNVDELDIYYDTASAWAVGDIVVNDTTGSNAIITYANTTAQFLRISAVNNNGFNETTNRPFNIGDSVRNLSSTKNSTINTVYNVLILDEPTNHLDMKSKDMLKEALKNFNGTIIIVSHDRNFLHELTDKIFEFNQGKIKPYLGDIYDFLKDKNLSTLDDLAKQKEKKSGEVKVEVQNTKSYNERKEEAKEIKRLENKLKRTEEEIAVIENKIKLLDQEMSLPSFLENSSNELFFANYQQLKSNLEQEYKNWENVALELETNKN